MVNKNRTPGFYWVRYKEWIVAEWDGNNWTVTHNIANYDDNDWAEIDERTLQKKNTVTAIFPGIGKVEISKERAEQIKRLQKIIGER